MKRALILLGFIGIIIIVASFLASALCTNSADDYAVEVLLNKEGISYNTDLLNSAQNVVIDKNKYILQSEYNPSLALILEKPQSPLAGLSVRIQIPVKSDTKTVPYLKFSTTSSKSLNFTGEEVYNGWGVSCIDGNPVQQCEFVKQNLDVFADRISSNYEINIEVSESLQSCKSCDGKCLSYLGKSACFAKEQEDDIQNLLVHFGFISMSESIFTSYKISSLGNADATTISPVINDAIDWKIALKQELYRLSRDSIIIIAPSDIDSISELAAPGKAGQNSRIVYGEDENNNKKWMYYYETKFPELTRLENCNEFSVSLVPTGMVVFSGDNNLSPYYIIPIVFTVFLAIMLVVLITLARVININKRKHRLKPVTSIQSSS